MKYLALLRGINVGGKNLVPMARLRVCLEALRLKSVTTYIQSGNALFESTQKDPLRLSRMIEAAVANEFGCHSLVIVVPEEQLEQVVNLPPADFGVDASQYLYDVVFLKPPHEARQVVATIRLRDGVDEAYEGNGVLYLRRLKERVRQSHFPKMVYHPAYKSMTIRNWRTTTELYRLMAGK